MTLRIIEIEGIQPEMAVRLRRIGINTSDKLLQTAATPTARQQLAAELGVEEHELLTWANRADLVRIPGIGRVFGHLLELSGVGTVMELCRRNPEQLFATVRTVAAKESQEHHWTHRTPRLVDIQQWIKYACAMERKIED